MAQIPKITIHIDLDNIDKLNDEALLSVLLSRYRPEAISGSLLRPDKMATLIPVFGQGFAKIVISWDLYRMIMGDEGVA